MFTVLLVILLGQIVPVTAPSVADVTRLQPSAAKLVAEIDTGKIQGDPVGLSWNTDGTLYLRASQRDVWGNERARHYLIATDALPSTLKSTDGVPQWAADYWVIKSQLFSPGNVAFKVDVETRTQTARTTNVANAGDLAGMSSAALPPTTAGDRGGANPESAAADAASKGYQSKITTMRLKGKVVGEWENVAPQPGMRFGWAPAGMDAMAFVNSKKRLSLLDREGHTVDVAGTADVLLPAWSPDGKQIAYLQKKDKKKYALMIVDLTER
jgi:hypothetical protein